MGYRKCGRRDCESGRHRAGSRRRSALSGGHERIRSVVGLAARARMGLVVYLGQVLEVKVGIDLGRADVGVPQQLLHRPDVLAALQEMRRERVAKRVR